MEPVIFPRFLRVGICITIFAAVQTGIISPYIPALNAMAALPHAFMFQVFEQETVCFS